MSRDMRMVNVKENGIMIIQDSVRNNRHKRESWIMVVKLNEITFREHSSI